MPLNTERLRAAIAKKFASHQAAADALGMMRPALSRLMSGKLDPKLGTIEKIANVCGVPVSSLIRRPAK